MLNKYKHSRLALLLWTALAILAGGAMSASLRGAVIVIPNATIHQAPAACHASTGVAI